MLLTLTSSDNESFPVERALLKHAGTIDTMITAMGIEEDSETEPQPIPLPNVNGATLKLVLEWLTLHKDDPVVEEKEDNGERNCDDVAEVDKKYLEPFADEKKHETVFAILLAANYLDVKGLLLICIKHIASKIKKCKTAEEIRGEFGIKNDFTKEEEEQIRKENEWCEN